MKSIVRYKGNGSQCHLSEGDYTAALNTAPNNEQAANELH